jgi:hypothetical protein
MTALAARVGRNERFWPFSSVQPDFERSPPHARGVAIDTRAYLCVWSRRVHTRRRPPPGLSLRRVTFLTQVNQVLRRLPQAGLALVAAASLAGILKAARSFSSVRQATSTPLAPRNITHGMNCFLPTRRLPISSYNRATS